jgi:hypothetical protein
MVEAVRTSEKSVNFNLTTRRYTPENSKIHTRRRENLKSHRALDVSRSGNLADVAISCLYFTTDNIKRNCFHGPDSQSVARLCTRKPEFAPWSVHIGSVMNRVPMAKAFFLVFRFSTVSSIILLGLHTHISPGRDEK